MLVNFTKVLNLKKVYFLKKQDFVKMNESHVTDLRDQIGSNESHVKK